MPSPKLPFPDGIDSTSSYHTIAGASQYWHNRARKAERRVWAYVLASAVLAFVSGYYATSKIQHDSACKWTCD